MNTNLKVGAIFLAGIITGALPSRLLGDGPDAERLEFQNARLYATRARLDDGGTSSDVAFEACGYLYKADAGTHYTEPCWRGSLSAESATPLVESMLSQYPR